MRHSWRQTYDKPLVLPNLPLPRNRTDSEPFSEVYVTTQVSEFWTDLAIYTDTDGCIAPTRGPHQGSASRNGLLYTSEAFITMSRLMANGVHYLSTGPEFTRLVNLCWKEPGLLKRGPHFTDQEGPDDYVGVIACSAIYAPDILWKIYNYGQNKTKLRGIFTDGKTTNLWLWKSLDFIFGWVSVRYNYNNVNPGTMSRSSWLGRQGQLIAHLHHALGTRPSFLLRMWWALAVFSASFAAKTDQDSWMLTWLLVTTYRGGSRLCTLASKVWWYSLHKNFGQEAQGICARTLEPGHPLGRYFVL